MKSSPKPRLRRATTRSQPVAWDLSAHAGKQGYMEIVDGDNGTPALRLAGGGGSLQSSRGSTARVRPANTGVKESSLRQELAAIPQAGFRWNRN